MSYRAFSAKQKRVLTWWVPGSPDHGKEAIICDGAVRSGKTLAMGLGFFLWAQKNAGDLIHPIWGKVTAFFMELDMTQEPREDYVAYSFKFQELTSDGAVAKG